MSVSLYMDQHVANDVTHGLRERGIDVLTAHEDSASDWDDESLLLRSHELGRVFYSQDSDLLVIAHRFLETGQEFSGLIYSHQLNITVGQAVNDLELISTVLELDDMRNTVQFIPL